MNSDGIRILQGSVAVFVGLLAGLCALVAAHMMSRFLIPLLLIVIPVALLYLWLRFGDTVRPSRRVRKERGPW